jgi:hypothetical protein
VLTTLLLTALLLLGSAAVPARAEAAVGGRLTDPSLLVGGYFPPRSGDFNRDAVLDELQRSEGAFGRRYDLVQWYYSFADTFPTWREELHLAQGRVPVIAWNGITDASSVAGGAYDALIRTRARGVRALGGPVVIRFAWEMDGASNPLRPESAATYVQEWRRIHTIFAQEGATNVVWMWCPNAWGFENGTAPAFYPGDDVVDWVGADGYDFAPLRPGAQHRSFEAIFADSYDWAKGRGKPFAIGEFGALEDPAIPGYKAAWYDAARQSLGGRLAGTKAAMTWSNIGNTYTDPTHAYDFRLDSSPTATAAWSRWAGASSAPGGAGGGSLSGATVGFAPRPAGGGSWLTDATGHVLAVGSAAYRGDARSIRLNRPIVGMASTPTGGGYWLVASDGGIFSYGDAPFYGSTGAIRLAKPIVSMAPTPTGRGYWLVASDGGVFAFGDARFFGSTGAIRLARPVVGMAATPSGDGYWLVASDGGIFAYGDAAFRGSTGAITLNSPVVGMLATLTGNGYWLVAHDGGIFSYGDAAFRGSTGSTVPPPPIVGMAARPGGGYILYDTAGRSYPFV